MLGIILVSKGLHTGKEVILAYPNAIYKENLSYFDSVHYNNQISRTPANKNFILGWPPSVIAELLCPKRERWETILDFSAESIRFIGYPVSIIQKNKSGKSTRVISSLSLKSQESEISSARIKETVATFNVVFAFDVDSNLLKESERIKEAIITLSKKYSDKTLKFEERRCGYLSSEIFKLKSIRDSSSSKELEILTMENESLLAKELHEVYTELHQKGECFVEINNWLKINLLINPPECKIECLPYYSLLFFDNPRRLEPFIADISPMSLSTIIMKKCKYPIVSFKDLADDEGLSYQAIAECALHFVRWNKAKFIAAVNSDSLFVNRPDFVFTKSLSKEWERTFKNKEEDLLKVLGFFSGPRSLKEIESKLVGKNKVITIVTWLLRKGVVIDAHYYLYLLIVRPFPKTKLFDESFDISRFDDQTEEFETLKAICRYCTGKNTVEEIIFASQKDLSMINRCVKHYDNYLKMIIH